MGKLKEIIKAYYDLVRLDHAFFIILAILVGQILTTRSISLLALIAPFFVSIGAFALNDYLDYETDCKNKRYDRPLVSSKIKPKQVKFLIWSSFILAFLTGYLVNLFCFFIVILFSLISILYDFQLKNTIFGNVAIALTMAIPFPYGAMSVGSLSLDVLIISAIAFFMGYGREIFKSIQDKKGDRLTGRKTLPILIGDEKAMFFAKVSLTISVFLGLFVWFFLPRYFLNPIYLLFYGLTVYFIFNSLKVVKKKNWKEIRKNTLYALFSGLLAFILPILF
ncbi:MAG: UbiA family prenyltransferase [archaeon]